MSQTVEVTRKLVAGEPLETLADLFPSVAEEMMTGAASPASVGAFLAATSLRGETAEMLAAFAATLRRHAVAFGDVNHPLPPVRLDTCGTGGDHSNSFNVSTATAFVVAGAGIPVVKHGNRGVTSRSGSADVLEALGIDITADPSKTREKFSVSNFAFLFAQSYHPAMKHVGPIRRELGFRTLFNLVGPLSNPAPATHQVVGVFSSSLVPLVAQALKQLGLKGALVVHGHGSMDELTLSGPNDCVWLNNGELTSVIIDGTEHGLPKVSREELAGGDAPHNAQIIEAILQGKGTPGQTNTVILNAAAALGVAKGNLDIRAGIEKARESILSGKAYESLVACKAASNE